MRTPARRRGAVRRAWPSSHDRPATSGKLTFFRVYSGTLKQGHTSTTPPRASSERDRPLLQMHANNREELDDSLRGRHRRRGRPKQPRPATPSATRTMPILLETMDFPEPVIAWPSSPRPRPTRRSWHGPSAWPRRTRPSASSTDEETGQTIISGMGELHLDVLVDRHVPRVQGRGQRRQAAGRLPGDDPRASRRSRAATSARPAARASTATPSSS